MEKQMSQEEIKAMQVEIYRGKVERARRMSPTEKFFVGEEMYRVGLALMMGNIQGQMPDASEEEWEAEVDRRLEIGRKLDEMKLRKTYAG